MNPFRPISISLSPNTEKDDIRLAFKLLFQPWLWKRGKAINTLEEEFKNYLGVKYAISFNSGRSSLLAILKSLELQKGSEILLQAFTCNAVPNPVIWSGFKPVYVDCDEKTFNIDAEDLKKKITKNSRAVVVQHAFGLPCEMDEILEICRQYSLILIEDCAHSLGAEYKNKKVGTFGQVSFFSFSRDKVISSVYGGIVATSDDNLVQKIKEYQRRIEYPSLFWIKQQLLHPLFMNSLILPTYSIFGKYLLVLFQWLRVLSKAVHWKEKRGRKPGYFPKKMPNALAILALHQFRKLEKFNAHRWEIAGFYQQELFNTKYQMQDITAGNVLLRFPMKHKDAHEIIRKAWNNNILIGDWYTSPVAPDDTRLEKVGYVLGTCPKAERLAKVTLNLPTHINISEKDAKKIVEFLKNVE